MVVDMAETEQADALFHALADPTRRDILAVVLQEAQAYGVTTRAMTWEEIQDTIYGWQLGKR